MDDFRSKSRNNGGLENTYNYYSSNFGDNNGAAPNYKTSSNPSGMQDLRCYSAFYASSSAQNNGPMDIVVAGAAGGSGEQWKFKKGKSTNGMGSKNWSLNDPELLRKKRVASYKAYTVEGKLKGSIKKSFRWIKERYTQMVHGYRS